MGYFSNHICYKKVLKSPNLVTLAITHNAIMVKKFDKSGPSCDSGLSVNSGRIVVYMKSSGVVDGHGEDLAVVVLGVGGMVEAKMLIRFCSFWSQYC